MVKDITTSQLDFLSFEEVSDRAAETISGGAEVVTDAGIEVAVSEEDILKPLEIAEELSGKLMGLLGELPTPDLGIINDFVSGFLDPTMLFGGLGNLEE